MIKFRIDNSERITKIITENDVNLFADVSGDHNPIHVDEIAASRSIFKKRIVHGMLGTSLISAVIGMKLPGDGTIYLSQTVNFIQPIYINDTITAHVKIEEVINKEKGILKLKTWVTNQNDEIVIDGQAVVKNTQCIIEQ